MAENLLTVAALRTTVEADLIRGKLEAAGISAVLVEPPPPADGAAPARVQVQVSQPDFERAMQLLFPIPKLKPAAASAAPAWQCPKCGEQVMGQFPTCWSCGTPRQGDSGGAQTVFPAVGTTPGGRLPPMPPPPGPPPGVPPPQMPPRISLPASAPTAPAALSMPPPPVAPPPLAAPMPPRPAMNGDSATKGSRLPPRRHARTAEDDGLKIVVPAWDPLSGKAAGGRDARVGEGTDANDGAARRAWWTSVAGVCCPPLLPILLIYSMYVILVLGLTNRPLSPRGTRYFYLALGLNALIMAAFFVIFGARQ